MTTKKKTNNATQLAADQALIDGLVKHAATLLTLLVGGSTIKTTDLVTVLQARIAAIKLAITTKATFMAAVAAAHAEIANTAALVSGARQALKIAFAGQIETLGDFGLKARKAPTPLTPEQKAAAVAKAKATRAARHTAGPKQKAKITGATATAAAPAVVAPAVTEQAQPAPVTPAVTPKS
jgi:hypothetical protein